MSRSSPKQSDHYNGQRFFNPTLTTQRVPGFKEIIKFIFKRGARWPHHVVNVAAPNLSDKPSLTFINHATFLVQLSNLTILTDSIWSKRASPFSWAGPKRVRQPPITLEDLPRVDVILISHNHYDHLDIKTLQKLMKLYKPSVIVPFGDKALLQRAGITNVTELDWWEHIDLAPNTRITFTPTQHGSARGLFDRDRSLWGSYFVQHPDKSIFFGGDAGYSTHYRDINQRLGAPDIALLGIGAYLPRPVLRTVHMDPTEAVQAHLDLKAELSIGMHYGTFRLSYEAIDQPPRDLKQALIDRNIDEKSFITLPEGQTHIIH